MDRITKRPMNRLGYDFIEDRYIPEDKDEYHIRYKQNTEVFKTHKEYRHLTAREMETLVQNNNASDDWNKLWVTEEFDPDLVKGCHFFGLVRIGKLEHYYLEFHNLRRPVGLYNSTICSCDLGDNVVIDNVNFMSHYIIGNETILVNINELSTSPHAKFGNGIVKDGEEEDVRIWLEICNENAGRKVLPFRGMLPGDAFIWSKYRDDEELLKKFVEFTEDKFDLKRGYYGVIKHHCVIKNSNTIKDCQIGNYAYIKGANKLKNLTINSSAEASSQIGEGCELVNGLIGYGCRIFYGVKAVRFIINSHSSLKYGARLINSFIGSNATVSCCEVLNSLIFPTHEQHHNNSFLCAALVMGQSNIAAGATIGSNHNSRSADGEVIFKRGVWPGLSVSLKHSSRFASFSLIAKGDYLYEIDSPIPFSLISNDSSKDQLIVMPGYWFLYNMYALSRNATKYEKRDHRQVKTQNIVYDYLAPDTVEEMFHSLDYLELLVGKASLKADEEDISRLSKQEIVKKGHDLLLKNPSKIKDLKVLGENIENSKREVILIKTDSAYEVFRKMISFYGIREMILALNEGIFEGFEEFKKFTKSVERQEWINVGGQLISSKDLELLKSDIKKGPLKNWYDVHHRYQEIGEKYDQKKLKHAIASLMDIKSCDSKTLTLNHLKEWIEEFSETSEWIFTQIKATRKKDYNNPFRTMIFDNKKEMESVIGKFSDDSFIKHAKKQNDVYQNQKGKVLEQL